MTTLRRLLSSSLLALAGAGCAHQPAPEPLSVESAAATADSRTAPRTAARTPAQQAQLDQCYGAAAGRTPALSVHTQALYFARAGRIVFAHVELPDQPELARCLSDAVASWPAPVPTAGESTVSGGIGIDLGPPLTGPLPWPGVQQFRDRLRRATLAALEHGALGPFDPQVQQLLASPPSFPTPAQRSELMQCYADSAAGEGAPELTREVLYLTRGTEILLADIEVPERPALESCLEGRIVRFPSPFPQAAADETALSTFTLSLGERAGAPTPVDPPSELARRQALISTALERGLIAPTDPSLARLKLFVGPVVVP